MKKNIRNYVNSSSLGVYSKYIKEINGTKYLVKSGRGYNETIEELLMDCDYSKCFETSNRKQLNLIDECTLNINIDYKPIILKYSKYFSDKRIEFILKLLENRIGEVKKCFFQNQN